MNFFIFIISLSTIASASSWNLSRGTAQYEVKHLIKKVTSESKEIKGKIRCESEICEFLIAIPVKSFVSSDANRDLNMQQVIEASKYPVTTAKGTFPQNKIPQEGTFVLPIEVKFHDKTASYKAEIRNHNNGHFSSKISIDLDKHSIVKPSLFGIAIDNEVLLTFDLFFDQIK